MVCVNVSKRPTYGTLWMVESTASAWSAVILCPKFQCYTHTHIHLHENFLNANTREIIIVRDQLYTTTLLSDVPCARVHVYYYSSI